MLEQQDIILPTKEHIAKFFELYCLGANYQDAEFTDELGLARYLSGLSIPIYNGVIQTKKLIGNPTEMIDNQIRYLKNKGYPFCCWVDDNEQKEDVCQHLSQQGMTTLGPFDIVVLPLDNYSMDMEPTQEVTVKQITTEEELQVFCDIICKVFFPRKSRGK